MSQNDSYSEMSHSSRPYNNNNNSNNNNNQMRSLDKRTMKFPMINSNVSSPNSIRPMDNLQNPPSTSTSYLPQKSKYIYSYYLNYCYIYIYIYIYI